MHDGESLHTALLKIKHILLLGSSLSGDLAGSKPFCTIDGGILAHFHEINPFFRRCRLFRRKRFHAASEAKLEPVS